MAAAAGPSSHAAAAAAAMKTRVRVCGGSTFKMEKLDKSPGSVHVHGSMIITRESRKIGNMKTTSEHHEKPPDSFQFDLSDEDKDPSFFLSYVACRDLIHRMLAEATLTAKYDLDLAADNWEGFKPHDTAEKIVDKVRRDTEDACGVTPTYKIDVLMYLHVSLTYSEPKALLLACKEAETEAADAFARGRKRRRHEPVGELCAVSLPGLLEAEDEETADAFARDRKRRRREPVGELCAICLSDLWEAQDEETVRLPCSHAFHDRCIGPWFHRSSTCPTCRHDELTRFDFVRSTSAWTSLTFRDIKVTTEGQLNKAESRAKKEQTG
uniref:Uncharacterized protein n=1 Tax=Avena sativa TaxID=4498 RepID=A0ACD5WM64_AVESA